GPVVTKSRGSAERAALEGQLDFSIEADDAGGKRGQRRPVAAIQGQLAHRGGFDLGGERRGGELDLWRSFRHLDGLTCLSDLQGNVELLLRAHAELNVGLARRAESRRRDGDFIAPRQKVGER